MPQKGLRTICPPLVEMADASYRNLDVTAAPYNTVRYALRAIDTYDHKANYYYGLANKALGQTDRRQRADSIWLAQSVEYRSAAFMPN